MAPRRSLVLLAAALAACAASPALGKTITVEMAKDGSGGSCPGSACNLRAAWAAAELGDTIMLGVNPVMSSSMGPLTSPQWRHAHMNGTVTLAGPSKTGAVVHGGSRFLAITSYPYSEARQVRLVIKNIEFSGFRYGSPTEGGIPGLILCISINSYCSTPSSMMETKEPSLTREESAPVRESHLLGETQTKYGNWSQLRKRAMLEIKNCVFRNNEYYAMKGASHASLISTKGTNSHFAHPVIMTSSQFMNNSISGYQASIGTVFGAEAKGTGAATALMISKCRFADNNMLTQNDDRIKAFQGPMIGNIGPISIYGSSFVGNTVGSSRAVISTGYTITNHVYIYDSSFIANGGNSQEPNSIASLIIGGWIVLHGVTASLPVSAPVTATQSPNDQYLHECSLLSDTGKAVVVAGFQMYNRNPVFTNLINGTDSAGAGSGFADCGMAAAWLPCRAGAACTTLTNHAAGVTVGYRCD